MAKAITPSNATGLRQNGKPRASSSVVVLRVSPRAIFLPLRLSVSLGEGWDNTGACAMLHATMTRSEALMRRYDHAAPGWGDKMRVLGYADACLGFLADGLPDARGAMAPGVRVCDVGCGTGAFA